MQQITLGPIQPSSPSTKEIHDQSVLSFSLCHSHVSCSSFILGQASRVIFVCRRTNLIGRNICRSSSSHSKVMILHASALFSDNSANPRANPFPISSGFDPYAHSLLLFVLGLSTSFWLLLIKFVVRCSYYHSTGVQLKTKAESSSSNLHPDPLFNFLSLSQKMSTTHLKLSRKSIHSCSLCVCAIQDEWKCNLI